MIILSETKNKTKFIKNFKKRLNFNECFVVEAMDRFGGMTLMWNNDIKI